MLNSLSRRQILATSAAVAASSSLPTFAFAQDAEAADVPVIADMVMGDDDAPITVIEYASFTCPHCANFHKDVFPQLRANYIDEGKVRFVFREVYFDRLGLWGAMLARCGDGMRYFGIADLLLGNQAEWAQAGSAEDVIAVMRRYGAQAGLSADQMDECLTDAAMAEALVAEYQKNAAEDQITGTPSFMINGEKFSNMSYADFESTLDGLLEDL